MPVIPATWEAEAEDLNPGGGGYSEPRLRHYTPASATEQDSVSKKKVFKDFVFSCIQKHIDYFRNALLFYFGS